MQDLTILMLTLNKVPKDWAEYHKKVLLEAVGDFPILTISKEPMDWGTNIIQTEAEGSSNVYWQMLKAAKIATTPYVAMAEDDVLYPREHFLFRPPLDTFAYNMSRWSLFTWEPVYNHRGRRGNFSLIAPRELLIETLEERFAKYPDGIPEDLAGEVGRERVDRRMGIQTRKVMEMWTTIPVVVFHHDFEMDRVAREHRKRMGALRAYDIPHWGKAEELVKHFI
jgi:hypothetical protein